MNAWTALQWTDQYYNMKVRKLFSIRGGMLGSDLTQDVNQGIMPLESMPVPWGKSINAILNQTK